MSESLAPIALFAYKRPEHLRRVTEALAANELAARSTLYVFCDAAKHESDRDSVDEVRRHVDSLEGFGSLNVVHRERNLGLARSVISGVTDILQKHHSVIVVEDDLVTSPHFLSFMNTGLQLYRDDESIASIHGYVYPTEARLPESFFLRGADCWGWATWPRAWAKFNEDGGELLASLERRSLTRRFDMDDSYAFTQMLRDQIAGRNDSWAIRWHASAFLENMLTLYPARSLIENVGLDSSGTHCATSQSYGGGVETSQVRMVKIPLEEHEGARKAFIAYFRANATPVQADRTAWKLLVSLRGVRRWLKRHRAKLEFRRFRG